MSSDSQLRLGKFSLGVGDRFAHQARAQLDACREAARLGARVIPVWNKSNREHSVIGSEPASVRCAADRAVRELGWTEPYHVDADHINLETVERYIPVSDFFTIDVADFIGRPSDGVDAFVACHTELAGKVEIPGIPDAFHITKESVARIAGKYLFAVEQAGRIYRHIRELRQGCPFVTEISMDETDAPQTPPELLVILAAVAGEQIPIQTIAPKFTGRFNKGVDYEGDVAALEREFAADCAVIRQAVGRYGLPENLKLSVHSGSDKFSIYPVIRRVLRDFDMGVHLKTAGTTWLEELIGLAESGGEGLVLAKEVYAGAYQCRAALCAPYAAVIAIREDRLPLPATVQSWSSEQYVSALRHDQSNSGFNSDFRQLLHVGYKIAAGMGERYLRMLEQCEAAIARNVKANLLERHIKPLFLSA
ncbi:MAG: hypothetical protein C5B51_17020 [Terriglobia bacterium]|nr:MAG: hypothetical protein C5B51_17020 [Terriglobia bacterium]